MDTLTQLAEQLTRKEHWQGWRSVAGKAAQDMPFELWMLNLSILTTAWVYWLFHAKARDRMTPNMHLSCHDHLRRIHDVLLASEQDIFATWDKQAWKALATDTISFGDVRAIKRLNLWEGLSWMQRLRARWRSLFT